MVDMTVLRRLVAAGVSATQLLEAVEAMEAKAAERKARKREADALRMRSKRDDLFHEDSGESPRVAESSGESHDVAATSATSLPPSPSPPSFPPHPHNNPLTPNPADSDDDEDRARPVEKPLVSQEAFALADTIGRDAGFEPSTTPPGWCGAAYVIQKFLDDGCPGEIVRLGCTTALRRKRDGPPERFVYFEKPIAQAFSEYRRPIPEVAVPKLEVIDGGRFGNRTGAGARPTSSTHGSLSDAARELRRELARQAEEIERSEDGMDCGAGRADGGLLPSR